MSKELKTLFQSVLLFFCLIVYWELLLYAVAHGSLRGIKGWFLLFALPQAMLPAALCGWAARGPPPPIMPLSAPWWTPTPPPPGWG